MCSVPGFCNPALHQYAAELADTGIEPPTPCVGGRKETTTPPALTVHRAKLV